jgi:hypothetical protein
LEFPVEALDERVPRRLAAFDSLAERTLLATLIADVKRSAA